MSGTIKSVKIITAFKIGWDSYLLVFLDSPVHCQQEREALDFSPGKPAARSPTSQHQGYERPPATPQPPTWGREPAKVWNKGGDLKGRPTPSPSSLPAPPAHLSLPCPNNRKNLGLYQLSISFSNEIMTTENQGYLWVLR